MLAMVRTSYIHRGYPPLVTQRLLSRLYWVPHPLTSARFLPCCAHLDGGHGPHQAPERQGPD
jgi:hypothetical protein